MLNVILDTCLNIHNLVPELTLNRLAFCITRTEICFILPVAGLIFLQTIKVSTLLILVYSITDLLTVTDITVYLYNFKTS